MIPMAYSTQVCYLAAAIGPDGLETWQELKKSKVLTTPIFMR